MMSDKPLMLKDYLELDSNSDTIEGFGRLASMRHLLEVELRGGSGRRQLIRSRSKNALLKLSSLIKLDFLLLSCSPSSINKRSRSRNFLKKNQTNPFWKKRGTDEERKIGDFTVKDIVRLRSFNLPTNSPLPCSSSSSSWSDSDFNGSDFLPSSNGSSEFIPDITGDNEKCSPVRYRTESSHAGSENKVVTSESTGCNSEEEEKDQLSPVSIMDFPYEEEGTEEESISDSSFHANLAIIERAKEALLQKLRRFESLAELVSVDLNNQFSDIDDESSGHPASDDDEVDEEVTIEMQAWKLLDHIKSSSPRRIEGCVQKLLLEFLIDGLSCSTQNDPFATVKLVNTAKKWIEGQSDCWEQQDCRGEIEIGQMDWNKQWRCFDEEQQELSVCFASGVLGSLVDELVGELMLC